MSQFAFEDEMGGETAVELPGFGQGRTTQSSGRRRRHSCAHMRTMSRLTS